MAVLYKKKCTIVACSEGEYKESLKLTKNATYINNGVNIKEIDSVVKDSSIKNIDTKNLKICIVGRIGFQKNPKLFNQIAEQFPQIQFTWIGNGELKDELKSPNISITGWTKRADVLSNLEKNDIFILPSLWEGLPIALLEAMYLGKICIVSNVIGNRDVIINGKNGFICNELEDYCNVINEIQQEKYNLAQIQKNAKEDVLQEYNIDITSKKYIELYNNCDTKKH